MSKKKKKKKADVAQVARERRGSKFGFYLCNIILGLVILIVFAVLFIVCFCRVEKVRVEGNYVNNEAVLESYVMDDQYCVNAVYVVLKNTFKPRKDIPFVDSYKVRMTGLNELLITVTEKERIGVIPDEALGKYVYYDESGNVTEMSEMLLTNLVVINGVTLEDPEIGKRLPMDNTQRRNLLSIQKQLRQVGVEVSAINFMEDGSINMNYQAVVINIGTTTNLAQKMKRLPYILPKLEGMSGTLHLEEWTEENTDIVFEKM